MVKHADEHPLWSHMPVCGHAEERRRIPGIEENLLVITGEKIVFLEGGLVVPDRPVIPFIEGDGTGPDIWRAAVKVLDGAVEFCCENMASP